MGENLQEKFIDKLIERYGEWEKITSKFGKNSFGEIADELCISNSQFSKLITGTATEGMYTRSIKNLDQLIRHENKIQELNTINLENEQLIEQLKNTASKPSGGLKHLLFYGSGALVMSIIMVVAALTFLDRNNNNSNLFDPEIQKSEFAKHPLSLYFDGDFESDYVSPYLNELEVQSYCPCSAYEGEWALESEYIIPLPSRKPGLYYVAKSADVRMKCQRAAKGDEKGKILFAFENIHNELWVDKQQRPLSPRYFNAETKTYTKDFHQLDFENNPDFVKVADIYSCFFNEFTITTDTIYRKGEPCGRFAEVVNQDIANEFEIDLQQFLENVIGSMTATKCSPAFNPYCDPNDLKENESTLFFDCFFSIQTENLGLGGGYPYRKTYKFIKQNYSDNLLCECK